MYVRTISTFISYLHDLCRVKSRKISLFMVFLLHKVECNYSGFKVMRLSGRVFNGICDIRYAGKTSIGNDNTFVHFTFIFLWFSFVIGKGNYRKLNWKQNRKKHHFNIGLGIQFEFPLSLYPPLALAFNCGGGPESTAELISRRVSNNTNTHYLFIDLLNYSWKVMQWWYGVFFGQILFWRSLCRSMQSSSGCLQRRWAGQWSLRCSKSSSTLFLSDRTVRESHEEGMCPNPKRGNWRLETDIELVKSFLILFTWFKLNTTEMLDWRDRFTHMHVNC